MCFSANASFGSVIVLAIIGVAAIRKTKSTDQLIFSFIPFVFAVQQLCEGFIWVSFKSNYFSQWRELYKYIFLFCAYIIWPIMIPYSIFKLEKKSIRKKGLSIIVGIGIFTSIIYSYSLILYSSEATILGHHIIYKLNYPSWVLIQGSFFYGIATLFSHFISSAKRVWVLGILILLSYMIASFYFQDYIISVWCYFAAIISTSIFFILKSINLKG